MSDSEYESSGEQETKQKLIKKSSSSGSCAAKRKASLVIRSDSECESSGEQEKQESKQKINKKTPTSAAAKRKAAAVARGRKKKETAAATFDVFGLSTNPAQAASSKKSNKSLSSTFVNKVMNGNEQRNAELTGEYFIDLKVYNTLDAESSKPEERWKKALVRVKFLTDDNSPQWDRVQKLVRSAHELFEDDLPVFYNNK